MAGGFLWQKHSFNKTIWQCLDADFTVRNYDACSHGHDVRPRLLAGWQAQDAVFCNCAVFVGVLAGFGNIYRLARQIYQKNERTGNENFFKRSMKPSGRCGSALFVGMSVRAGIRLVGKGQAVQRSWHPDRDLCLPWQESGTCGRCWIQRWARDGAQKYAVSKNLLRYAVVLVVFAVLMLTHFADPLAAFAGLMGMKASAYLQPFIRGYKERRGGETMTNGILLKWFG